MCTCNEDLRINDDIRLASDITFSCLNLSLSPNREFLYRSVQGVQLNTEPAYSSSAALPTDDATHPFYSTHICVKEFVPLGVVVVCKIRVSSIPSAPFIT